MQSIFRAIFCNKRIIFLTIFVIFLLFCLHLGLPYKPTLYSHSLKAYVKTGSIHNEDEEFLIGQKIFNSSNDTVFTRCMEVYDSKTSTFAEWLIQPQPCDIDVTIVILIKSSTVRNRLRHALRRTWVQEVDTDFGRVKRIFVLGSAPVNQTTPIIEEEGLIENDILQGDFEDTYHNVARKVMMGLHFIKNHCPQAKRIVVADDDAIVLPWNLFPIIMPSANDKNDFYYSGFITGNNWPIRNNGSRWYVKPEEYNCTMYPYYAIGTYFILSMKTLQTFHYLSQVVSYFWIEDVYFGVLAKISNISIIPFPPGSILHDYCGGLLSSHSSQSVSDKLIACHNMDEASDIIKVWSEFCYSPTASDEKKKIVLKYCSYDVKSYQ